MEEFHKEGMDDTDSSSDDADTQDALENVVLGLAGMMFVGPALVIGAGAVIGALANPSDRAYGAKLGAYVVGGALLAATLAGSAFSSFYNRPSKTLSTGPSKPQDNS